MKMSWKTRTHGSARQVGKKFRVMQKKKLPPRISGGKVEREYVSKFYHKNSPPLEMWKDVALEALGESRDMLEDIEDKTKRVEMEKQLNLTVEQVKSARTKGSILRIIKQSSNSPHSPFLAPPDKPMLEYGMEKYLREKKLIPYKPMKSEILMGKLKYKLSKEFNVKEDAGK